MGGRLPAPVLREVGGPFPAGAIAPNITTDSTGAFIVSWVDASSKTLSFVRFADGAWSPVQVIARNVLGNKADLPVLAASGADLFAGWPEPNGHGSRIRVARSSDGGRTWSRPATPHPDLESEFGFVSLAPGEGGVLHTVWLDGRALPGGEEGAGDMQLRYATLNTNGTFSESVAVDSRVCDCCQTSLVMAGGVPIVAYRDRSDSEIRDISLGRLAGSTRGPYPFSKDGWKILGCPVNGPRLASRGVDMVGTWFTAAQNKPRVTMRSWREGPTGGIYHDVAIDLGNPAGHLDIGFLDQSRAVVSWIEQRGDAATVELASVLRTAGVLQRVTVATTPSARVAGFPRIAVSGENVGVVWNDKKSVRFAVVTFHAR